MENSIYKITNNINGKVYIGKTKNTIEERFKQHIKDAYKETKEKRPLYQAIRKYGESNFTVELIETDISDGLISEKEKEYIKEYNSYIGFPNSNGYNATLGGDGKQYKEYDIQDIINKYEELKVVNRVAEYFNLDKSYISRLLKANGVEITPSQEVEKKLMGKRVYQIDPKTQEIVNTFDSIMDAKKFLGLKKSNGHLKDVLHSEKHSGYNSLWYFEEDYNKF